MFIVILLTNLGICHPDGISKIILPEKLPLNLTGIGEVVHTFPFLGAPSQSNSNAVPGILASHFTLSSWWAEFSVELTVNFQIKQLLIGIQQLVQTECFGLWQPPSSTQTGMSYKTAHGAPKSTFFGKRVMDFQTLLWHLRSCFFPVFPAFSQNRNRNKRQLFFWSQCFWISFRSPIPFLTSHPTPKHPNKGLLAMQKC